MLIISANSLNGSVIEVKFEPRTETDLNNMFVEKLFRNPALVTSFSSGTDALNKSIDSLMEAIFYQIMDQELSIPVSEYSAFKVGLNRKLYSNSDGSWIVLDRFALGPKLEAPLTFIENIAIPLSAEAQIDVSEVYLRSDSMRLTENQEQPFLRVALNNWLGTLPFISSFLPPSFNPNEIYDPITTITTPTKFPFTIDKTKNMPIGTIRSYGISGNINVPINLTDSLGQIVPSYITDKSDNHISLFLSPFRNTEYRVNVFKKSTDIIWVGISNRQQIGIQGGIEGGKSVNVLDKVLPFWGGVPAPFLPINLQKLTARGEVQQQIFEFDTSNPAAKRVYKKIVRGDPDSIKKYRKAHPTNEGVKFKISSIRQEKELSDASGRNFFVLRDTRNQKDIKAEVTQSTVTGKTFALETKHQVEDENWNILVGSQQGTHSLTARIKVVPAKKDERKNIKSKYIIDQSASDPISLIFSFDLLDRFVDAEEYQEYRKFIKNYSKLPMNNYRSIPLRDHQKVIHRRYDYAYSNPLDADLQLNVTPTWLGFMGIVATNIFDSDDIKRILKSTNSEKWSAFARAFGISAKKWSTEKRRSALLEKITSIGNISNYPLELINLRIPYLEAQKEASTRIAAMGKLFESITPEEKIDALNHLLNTKYPSRLNQALLYLATADQVDRRVFFRTKVEGSLTEIVKNRFASLNGKVFQSDNWINNRFTDYQKKNLRQMFQPQDLKEWRMRPRITNAQVVTKKKIIATRTSHSKRKEILQNQIYVALNATKISSKSVNIYIRVEEGGDIDFGRFLFTETVIKVDRVEGSKHPYQFYLTGPKSPLEKYFMSKYRRLEGLFELTISISEKGRLWSDAEKVKFRFENRQLLKPNG